MVRLFSALLIAAAPAAALAQAEAPAPVPAPPPSDGSFKGDAQAAAYEIGEITAAADGAFGEATEGVAMVVQKVFADLGKPTAYIVGREGSGAFIVGLRYGSGKLFSKIEGERPVYWTGPSVGPDVGGDASRSFVLVYNLHDSEELYQRFPAVEGKAYLIGGVSANYHQRGNIILVPIRLGAGWRLGANVGYLKYTKGGSVIPF
ncbi:DUF1134 domain-containing protein [Sandaracinobacter neustonicus]|uniref:DUF1134 domain-containing protein n=2 Tax=Sandaracinobacter neustonicus TaxID=1715348 RepID=A0A501XLD2_9SPHN|nr:DUF1134 domain-containing protein [Sandaracinobacter neustonicus]